MEQPNNTMSKEDQYRQEAYHLLEKMRQERAAASYEKQKAHVQSQTPSYTTAEQRALDNQSSLDNTKKRYQKVGKYSPLVSMASMPYLPGMSNTIKSGLGYTDLARDNAKAAYQAKLSGLMGRSQDARDIYSDFRGRGVSHVETQRILGKTIGLNNGPESELTGIRAGIGRALYGRERTNMLGGMESGGSFLGEGAKSALYTAAPMGMGISSGLGAAMTGKRLRSYEKDKDMLGRSGRVARVSGGLTQMRNLGMIAPTLGLSAMSHLPGIGGIAGMAATGARKTMFGGTNLLGAGAMKAVGMGGMGAVGSTAASVAGGGLLALPSIISAISSMKAEKKRMKLRGKREPHFKVEKKYSQSGQLDSFINRLVSDNQITSSDQIKIDLLRMIESHTSPIGEIAAISKFIEEQRDKDVKTTEAKYDDKLKKWDSDGEKPGGIKNTASRMFDSAAAVMQKTSYKYNPFQQLGALILEGKSPKSILKEFDEEDTKRKTFRERQEFYKQLAKETGLSISQLRLMQTPSSALMKLAESPEAKQIILLGGIFDLIRTDLIRKFEKDKEKSFNFEAKDKEEKDHGFMANIPGLSALWNIAKLGKNITGGAVGLGAKTYKTITGSESKAVKFLSENKHFGGKIDSVVDAGKQKIKSAIGDPLKKWALGKELFEHQKDPDKLKREMGLIKTGKEKREIFVEKALPGKLDEMTTYQSKSLDVLSIIKDNIIELVRMSGGKGKDIVKFSETGKVYDDLTGQYLSREDHTKLTDTRKKDYDDRIAKMSKRSEKGFTGNIKAGASKAFSKKSLLGSGAIGLGAGIGAGALGSIVGAPMLPIAALVALATGAGAVGKKAFSGAKEGYDESTAGDRLALLERLKGLSPGAGVKTAFGNEEQQKHGKKSAASGALLGALGLGTIGTIGTASGLLGGLGGLGGALGLGGATLATGGLTAPILLASLLGGGFAAAKGGALGGLGGGLFSALKQGELGKSVSADADSLSLTREVQHRRVQTSEVKDYSNEPIYQKILDQLSEKKSELGEVGTTLAQGEVANIYKSIIKDTNISDEDLDKKIKEAIAIESLKVEEAAKSPTTSAVLETKDIEATTPTIRDIITSSGILIEITKIQDAIINSEKSVQKLFQKLFRKHDRQYTQLSGIDKNILSIHDQQRDDHLVALNKIVDNTFKLTELFGKKEDSTPVPDDELAAKRAAKRASSPPSPVITDPADLIINRAADDRESAADDLQESKIAKVIKDGWFKLKRGETVLPTGGIGEFDRKDNPIYRLFSRVLGPGDNRTATDELSEVEAAKREEEKKKSTEFFKTKLTEIIEQLQGGFGTNDKGQRDDKKGGLLSLFGGLGVGFGKMLSALKWLAPLATVGIPAFKVLQWFGKDKLGISPDDKVTVPGGITASPKEALVKTGLKTGTIVAKNMAAGIQAGKTIPTILKAGKVVKDVATKAVPVAIGTGKIAASLATSRPVVATAKAITKPVASAVKTGTTLATNALKAPLGRMGIEIGSTAADAAPKVGLFKKMQNLASAAKTKAGKALDATKGAVSAAKETASGVITAAKSSKVGKALVKTSEVVGKYTGKAVKAVGGVAGKVVKAASVKTLETVAKKVPLISAVVGTGLAFQRYRHGDRDGALLELASGLAATLPGYGTAASIGIDAAILARDIVRAKKEGKVSPELLEKEKETLSKLQSTMSAPAFALLGGDITKFEKLKKDGSILLDTKTGIYRLPKQASKTIIPITKKDIVPPKPTKPSVSPIMTKSPRATGLGITQGVGPGAVLDNVLSTKSKSERGVDRIYPKPSEPSVSPIMTKSPRATGLGITQGVGPGAVLDSKLETERIINTESNIKSDVKTELPKGPIEAVLQQTPEQSREERFKSSIFFKLFQKVGIISDNISEMHTGAMEERSEKLKDSGKTNLKASDLAALLTANLEKQSSKDESGDTPSPSKRPDVVDRRLARLRKNRELQQARVAEAREMSGIESGPITFDMKMGKIVPESIRRGSSEDIKTGPKDLGAGIPAPFGLLKETETPSKTGPKDLGAGVKAPLSLLKETEIPSKKRVLPTQPSESGPKDLGIGVKSPSSLVKDIPKAPSKPEVKAPYFTLLRDTPDESRYQPRRSKTTETGPKVHPTPIPMSTATPRAEINPPSESKGFFQTAKDEWKKFKSSEGVQDLTHGLTKHSGIDVKSKHVNTVVEKSKSTIASLVNKNPLKSNDTKLEAVAKTTDKKTDSTVKGGGSSSPISKLISPVKGNTVVTSPFGPRNVGLKAASKNHKGVDLRGKIGDPVVSVLDGKVTSAGGRYGTIVVDHGSGIVTRYLHLSKLDVKPGEVVTEGQKIGEVGNTAPSSYSGMRPHLHFETRFKGKPVDPEIFYNTVGAPRWSYASDIVESRQLSAKLSSKPVDVGKLKEEKVAGGAPNIMDMQKTFFNNASNDITSKVAGMSSGFSGMMSEIPKQVKLPDMSVFSKAKETVIDATNGIKSSMDTRLSDAMKSIADAILEVGRSTKQAIATPGQLDSNKVKRQQESVSPKPYEETETAKSKRRQQAQIKIPQVQTTPTIASAGVQAKGTGQIEKLRPINSIGKAMIEQIFSNTIYSIEGASQTFALGQNPFRAAR